MNTRDVRRQFMVKCFWLGTPSLQIQVFCAGGEIGMLQRVGFGEIKKAEWVDSRGAVGSSGDG